MPMSPRLLRPRASGTAFHAEAIDWASRVTANGGTVTTNTLAAVSTFCASIQAAGIRDRFYRLNLFCGDQLAAALVPLYRAESSTASVRGNATDTNNNFVSGDYSLSSGLTRTAGTKYLNTGLAADAMPQTDRHLSVFANTSSAVGSAGLIGVDNFPSPGNAFWSLYSTGATSIAYRSATSSALNTVTITSGNVHFLVSGNGTAQPYVNGSASTATSGTAFSAPSLSVFVGAVNRGGSFVDINGYRIMGYSIGLGFTSSQASSFNSAIAALQSSLGR